MKTALWISGCLFAGLVGQNAVAAEFDTLTVVVNGTGLKEFKKTVNMGETLTIDYGRGSDSPRPERKWKNVLKRCPCYSRFHHQARFG